MQRKPIGREDRIVGAAVTYLTTLSRGEVSRETSPDPLELAQQAELRRFVLGLQACLTRRQRVLLFLRYDTPERTFGEIAAIMETTEGAVVMLHSRTIRRLRSEAAAQDIQSLLQLI